MKTLFFSVLFLSCIFVSCDSRKKQEQDAERRLKHIEQLLSSNSLNAAKIELDSIHALYPKLIAQRRIAAALQDTIARRENARNMAYCKQLLPIRLHEVDSIQKAFHFEKNEKYQDVGNYVFKSLVTEANTNRCYLKAFVDEQANLFLVSNYTGPKMMHSSVEVASQGVFAHTDTLDVSGADFHAFDDEGSHWETLTFKNENDRGVLSFVAQHFDSPLKVTLYGKRTYSYELTRQDKVALTATYRLWLTMKDAKQLSKEIAKSQAILDRIKEQK